MNTTVRLKASEIYKDWHVIDAADRPLGRVASEAAILLRGKHKPTFEPHLDGGDFVIVINASKVRVTGAKAQQNKYYRHSGYPGGLKTRTYTEQMARFPDRVIEQAVWGMLPGGSLGEKMLKHLKVYAGPNHPHASQIAFTATSQAARGEATEALATQERKAPRLRPLSIPQQPQDTGREGAVQSPAEKKSAARAKAPGRAPAAAAEATAAAELEATDEAVLTSETPPPAAAAVNEDTVLVENASPAEAAIQQGEAIAETVEAEAKPKRTRKAATAETATGDAAPKAPRTRKPKAEAETKADGEPKKTTRRRTPPKSEE